MIVTATIVAAIVPSAGMTIATKEKIGKIFLIKHGVGGNIHPINLKQNKLFNKGGHYICQKKKLKEK